MVYFGWVGLGGHFLLVSGDRRGRVDVCFGQIEELTFLWLLMVCGGIFWVSGGGWTFFMDWWQWVGLGGHFLLVSGDVWERVDVYFGQMGGWTLLWLLVVGGGILWVSGGGWTFFMDWWGWVGLSGCFFIGE